MQYNTQRNKLNMPEYGRGVQSMVELAISLPTKEERQICANTIISIMSRVLPPIPGQEDYNHKLWNHLARIARYELDIDYPVEIVREEEALAHPKPLHYPMKNIHRRHYGYLIEETLRYAQTLPEGEERQKITEMVANQMKQNLFVWNRDAMDDELIAQDIDRYTKGELHLDLENFRFASVGIPSTQQAGNQQGNKRKKKK